MRCRTAAARLGKIGLPAATRTRSPVWGHTTRKCPGRERWIIFRSALRTGRGAYTASTGSCGKLTADVLASCGRFSGQTLDACAVAARGAGPAFTAGLVERNSFLPEVVSRLSSVVRNASASCGIWIRTSRPTGQKLSARCTSPPIRRCSKRRSLCAHAIASETSFSPICASLSLKVLGLFPPSGEESDGSRTPPLGVIDRRDHG